MKTYIIGHQKPDTDAVVSALAFKHLFDHQACWGHSDSIACITHDLNPETKFVFDKFKTQLPQLVKAGDIPADAKVVLVDHNEASQRLEGLNPDQITDIFDHHKVSLNLNTPIFITIKPWGSTATIAWHLIDLAKIDIPQSLAGLMLCAVLSDTVGFKSATTTDQDKQAAQALAKIAQIKDLDALALEIFKAKSNISQLTDQQIVTNDYKIYDFKQKVFIGQLETVEQNKLLSSKKGSLLKAMQQVKDQQKVDLLFLAISDVLKVNTQLLILSDKEKAVAQTAFGGQIKDSLLDIGPKLSRKKQIAPAIEKALT